MKTKDEFHSLDLNDGQLWTVHVEHTVVYRYPFPMERIPGQGNWLGVWFIRQGRAECKLDGRSIVLSKGDAVFFTPKMILKGEHDLDDPVELIGIRLTFRDRYGEPFFPHEARLPKGHFSLIPGISFEACVFQLLRTWRNPGLRRSSVMHALGLQLLSVAWLHEQKAGQTYAVSQQKTKIAQIIDLIHDGYDREWTMEALANAAQMDPGYMAKLFKRITGVSPNQYLIKTRIDAASSLLVETNQSIGDISVSCGYQDLFFFSKQFKSITGLTPTEYRYQMTKDDPVRAELDRRNRW